MIALKVREIKTWAVIFHSSLHTWSSHLSLNGVQLQIRNISGAADSRVRRNASATFFHFFFFLTGGFHHRGCYTSDPFSREGRSSVQQLSAQGFVLLCGVEKGGFKCDFLYLPIVAGEEKLTVFFGNYAGYLRIRRWLTDAYLNK